VKIEKYKAETKKQPLNVKKTKKNPVQ